MKFSLKQRLKSFEFALNGIRILLKEEHNARIHLVAAIAVTFAGFYFNISVNEWVGIILSIGLVFSLELVNSSIESLADFVSPKRHKLIKKVKDLAAGGVLIAAISAVFVGLIVFFPKILAFAGK